MIFSLCYFMSDSMLGTLHVTLQDFPGSLRLRVYLPKQWAWTISVGKDSTCHGAAKPVSQLPPQSPQTATRDVSDSSPASALQNSCQQSGPAQPETWLWTDEGERGLWTAPYAFLTCTMNMRVNLSDSQLTFL